MPAYSITSWRIIADRESWGNYVPTRLGDRYDAFCWFDRTRAVQPLHMRHVDTREPDRDKDLRSEKFFDVAHFPTMTFKSKKIEQVAPGKLKVTGDLTIRGTTKEVVLDVEGPTPPVKDPWGNVRAAATATSKVNRQDFGVKWNATLDNGGVVVGDDVNITIDAEMIKQAPAKSGD